MDKCSYHYPTYRLLVFSKAPRLGTVKTRMQPALTAEESLQLHIALSRYCLQQWSAHSLCPIDIWVAGSTSVYQQFITNEVHYCFHPQVGNNLGERMAHAVNTAFQSASISGVILVGTDCPFIEFSHLQQTLCLMEQGRDVVIIPANDGGYVLLGLKYPQVGLFEDVQWGGQQVYADTIEKVRQLNLAYHAMESLPDIDRPEDLPLLHPLNLIL